MAWHVAALSRAKKLPELKSLYATQTSRPRQSWREQLAIMTRWAAEHNAANREKEKLNGR